MKKKIVQYIIYVFLLIFSLIVAITGVVKFPGLLNLLRIDNFAIQLGLLTFLHDWGGLALTLVSILHIIVNWKWIQRMTKQLIKRTLIVPLLWIITVSIIFAMVILNSDSQRNDLNLEPKQIESPISKNVENYDYEVSSDGTLPREINQIDIEGVGSFEFNPQDISSVRSDIFKEGYFSVFDILVYLDVTDQINLKYEFSEEFQTNKINEINGIGNWWYLAFYDGGWPEKNIWRMDLFPYKDRMAIQIIQIDELSMFNILEVFSKDAKRKMFQGNNVIIPKIIIRGQNIENTFNNIEIKAHNLRNDFFVEGTITAIDAVLTLGDLGLISNSIQWHESIGSAGVVKNYFVNEINGEKSVGRCGFVYEIGEYEFLGFRGNHIHIPSDLRIIDTIPEYIEYFWICI